MPASLRLAIVGLIVLLPKPDSVRAEDEDSLADLVISGGEKPLRIRLIVSCDGQLWRDYATMANRTREESLFAQLDSDSNGTLSESEARRLPADAWAQPDQTGRPAAFVAFNFRAMDIDDDGVASPSEFASYVAVPAAAPFKFSQIDRAVLPPGRRLFSMLDTDRNGWLSKDESSNAAKLFRYDQSGDRLLTGDELTRNESGAFGPEFIATARADRNTFRGPLTCEVSPNVTGTPDAILDVRYSSTSHETSIRFSSEKTQLKVAEQSRGQIVLNLAGRQIELRLIPGGYRPVQQAKSRIRQQFDRLANESGQYLLSRGVPDSLRSLGLLADQNSDGAVDREELRLCLDNYIAARVEAHQASLRLAVVPESRSLERLVDQNLDGRLSRREIHRLPAIMQGLRQDQRQFFRKDVPARLSILLQRGTATVQGIPRATDAAPAWFVRSDRNRDGDIDRDEFLGTPQDFERLNTNGDEWIDRHEAILADSSD